MYKIGFYYNHGVLFYQGMGLKWIFSSSYCTSDDQAIAYNRTKAQIV